MARIRFTQAARKHRVAIVPVRRAGDARVMQLHLGDDDTGRALEVGVIDTGKGGAP